MGAGCLPSLLPPSKADFLTSFQALPRVTLALKDRALTWKQDGSKRRGEVPWKLRHPSSSPCINLLPGSREKGTEIKAGFLTLIRAEGDGGV